jgi:hypothetical protein
MPRSRKKRKSPKRVLAIARMRYVDDTIAQSLIENIQKEINLYRDYSKYYGYEFLRHAEDKAPSRPGLNTLGHPHVFATITRQ